MRPGRAASRTCIAKNISALHCRARGNDESRHVQVHGFEALAVIDTDGVTEHVELFGKVDGARGYSANRFTFRVRWSARDTRRWVAVVQTFDAKGRSHAAGNRCGQEILPRTGIGDCISKY